MFKALCLEGQELLPVVAIGRPLGCELGTPVLVGLLLGWLDGQAET